MKKKLEKGDLILPKTPRINSSLEGEVKWRYYYDLLGLIIIILLGISIYSNSFKCSFHFDDTSSIVENKQIRNLSDIRIWLDFNQSRIVSYFSFAVNYHFGQLDVWGYHLINLIIHLLSACLVWWFTIMIFSSPVLKDLDIVKHKKVIGFFTALLFVSHPLATQSVTYIVQRMASLVAMFYLLSLVLYLKARLSEHGSIPKTMLFACSLLSAMLAFFTKENAYTLPFAIVLVEFCFVRTKNVTINFRDYRLILIIAGLVGFIIIVAIKYSFDILKPIPPSLGIPYTVTPLNYLFTQFSVILKYIQLLFLPINQNLEYDFPISNTLFEIRTLLSLLALLLIIALGIFLYNRNRIISFGIFWFFLTLSIESSFIPIKDVIFEHRTYLPSYGFFLILSSGIYFLFWNKFKVLAIAVLLIIVGVNSILTYKRNKIWKDEITLWSDVISKSPGIARPYVNRGNAYGSLGQHNKALSDYSKAIQINPNYATPYSNRGAILDKRGQWDKAIADYSNAIRIDPEYAEAYTNRGIAYGNLGKWNEAITDYTTAIKTDSSFADSYLNRGIAYSNLELWDKSILDFKRAIELNPGNSIAYSNRGAIYDKLGQWDKAIVDYSKAIDLNPKNARAYYNRGIAYGNFGKWNEAIADYSTAIKHDSKFVTAFVNRGFAYMKQGNWNNAITDYSKAIEINPGFIKAYFDRGVAFGNIGKWDKALSDYNKVLELDPNYANAYSYREYAVKKLKSGK